MHRTRAILGVVGTTAVALGLVGILQPGVVSGLSTPDVFVPVLALVALVQAGRAIAARRGSRGRAADTPDPEYQAGVVVPGDEFDRGLADRDPAIRDRLEATTRAVLDRQDGLSETEASDRLDDGTWTDDPNAGAFFSSDVQPPSPTTSSTSSRLPRVLSEQPSVTQQARHVVAALARRFDLSPVTQSSSSERGDTARDDEITPMPPRTRQSDTDDLAYLPSLGEVIDRQTGRWTGVSAVALVAGAIGILVRAPSLLLVGAVGLALAAYTTFGRRGDPTPIDLTLTRTISDSQPAPDETVTVTTTVRNTGDTFLPDLRIIDGVPPRLVVTDGSPRRKASLRPGESDSFTYTLTATHGEHSFQPALVVARDLTGGRERLQRTAASDATDITCRTRPDAADEMPLRAQTTNYTGRVSTDIGGTGVEFYATRDYRPGDPPSLVDWNRLASTGELATLEFREERAASVVLAIDARREAYLAPTYEHRSAVDRSLEAAELVFETLLDHGNQVGLTALSPEPCWLPPSSGSSHRARLRQRLADHAAFPETPPEGNVFPSIEVPRLRRKLSGSTQLVIFSPLGDDSIADFARTMDAMDHRVTVISPDPTTQTTPGRQLAHIERLMRLSTLRAAEIPVHDWPIEDSLAVQLARARSIA